MGDESFGKNHLENWAEAHLREILGELKAAGIELILGNIPRIIQEISFSVRSKKYSDKCVYYKENPPKSCHPELKDLNCFLCACPDYENTRLEGGCRVDLPLGKWFRHTNLPKKRIWDCTDCCIPHIPKYVENYLIENIARLRREFR